MLRQRGLSIEQVPDNMIFLIMACFRPITGVNEDERKNFGTNILALDYHDLRKVYGVFSQRPHFRYTKDQNDFFK